jgi:N-acyl-D-aspartate/D-glutamate deacylase
MDTIIRNGLIYDGTLGEPFAGDVGIIKDKIAAIGRIACSSGRVIDASGCIVTPGFVDVHTHCDLTFKKAGFFRFLANAVPSWKGNYNYISQGVTTVVTGNCGWGFTDSSDWLNMIGRVGFGTNVCHLAPHGDIREEMFGVDAGRSLTTRELERFKAIIAIAKVVRSYGGIYATHVRNESGEIRPSGFHGDVESISEAIEIGRQAEIPVQISHLKILNPINDLNADMILELIEKARMEGLSVDADQYPYNASSSIISILLPPEFRSSSGIRDRYKTADGRKSVKAAIDDVFNYLPPEKIMISFDRRTPSNNGKNILEISERKSKSPADVFVDMVCEKQAPFGVFTNQDMDVVVRIMPHEYIFTASDGATFPKGMLVPHPRCYGTFTRKLRKYVLDDKAMGLKEAIASMTSLPAAKFGIKGRGRIAEGNFADIAVIDIDNVSDLATYTKPHQYSKGIKYLIINGVISMDESGFTGKRGGIAIRKA